MRFAADLKVPSLYPPGQCDQTVFEAWIQPGSVIIQCDEIQNILRFCNVTISFKSQLRIGEERPISIVHLPAASDIIHLHTLAVGSMFAWATYNSPQLPLQSVLGKQSGIASGPLTERKDFRTILIRISDTDYSSKIR